MKRKRAIAMGLLFASAAVLFFWFRNDARPKPASGLEAKSQAAGGVASPVRQVEVRPGDAILADYGTPRSTPEQDLGSVARAMDSFLLLVKAGNRGPLADNEDWAAAWLGLRGYPEPFVSASHPIIGGQGRLLDRWKTPLFVHALGGARYEIRSAGPDRKLWTADDVHRNADGSFLRGTDLNPASLSRR